ncbi:hypothetical protein B4Q13_20105 [Lacticaseibacillus rhamnosus]
MRAARNGAEEVKEADHPDIRYFTVGTRSAYHPVSVVEGTWKVVTPDSAQQLSAVAYYFARRVQQNSHVPIGLIVDAVGGTPAESWTSASALRPLKDFDVPLAELDRLGLAALFGDAGDDAFEYLYTGGVRPRNPSGQAGEVGQ